MANKEGKQPNFLIIVADDLGFSDTGPYGSEISTPSLDRLAKDGLRMTDFHTAAACSPTRAMLFSGTDNHIAGLGQMAEFLVKNKEEFKDKPGYEGFLNFRIAAMPEILQDAGYLTIFSGKWHLGMTAETSPSSRGFTKSFSYLPGAGSHYNFEPQFDYTNRLPPVLQSGGFWMDGLNFINRQTDIPDSFYSTDYFADRVIDFLDKRTEEEKQQPFFACLAFTAPHWPLQAPQDIVAKYKGFYDDGPEQLRLRRVHQLQKLGLVPEGIEPAPMNAQTPGWADMTAEERAISAKKMEVYAAMVDRMDTKIGHVLDKLESTGELDNTMVVFMSDNGAEGAIIESLPLAGSLGMANIIARWYDNRIENIGAYNSFVGYGDQWALAATAPSRGFKTWSTEGGIRCPCIVRFPRFSRASSGNYTHEFGTVMDILPTLLEMANIPSVGKSFRGRDVMPVRGKSWVPYLSAAAENIHPTGQDITGWELFGMRAIRRGDWKAVYLPEPKGKGQWELYNLVRDPGEVNDLAEQDVDILNQLLADWEVYIAETGAIEINLGKNTVKGL
ncbi:arylsulfatase-4 [Coleophoma cylindrospora]|uniref:Arylsulfatase-4 n=1 Tax=Coleophoma cylindrospora TaxID=1849047 RepID=A0A3D8Q5S6_9HELO|nr:arylsulfatase-4 [Coleophoma cylindrospora]